MRWLFLFILSLNLAYIGWEISKSPSEGYADVAPLRNVEPIVLLSELNQRQEGVTKAEGGRSEEPGTEERFDRGATDDVVAENIVNSGIPGGAVAPKGLVATQVSVAEKKSQVVPEITAEVEADISGRSASVKQSEQAIANMEVVKPVDVVSQEPSQAARCYTLGPFRDLDMLRGLTREIKSYVDKADFRGHEEKEPTLYWVYIKPENSRKKAIETGNRLRAKKIKDFYVIRDGEKENGLSLGHFRNKDGAYGLAKKVKNLGFNVMVEPVLKTYTVYWLDYQLSSGVTIPESIFDKYTKVPKKEKISRLSRDCGA